MQVGHVQAHLNLQFGGSGQIVNGEKIFGGELVGVNAACRHIRKQQGTTLCRSVT